jgi:hypothetical protein
MEFINEDHPLESQKFVIRGTIEVEKELREFRLSTETSTLKRLEDSN